MASQNRTDLETYFASVPQESRFKLDRSLDYDHDGVQRDLGTIANSMDQWEGNVAEQFQLTRYEIQAIKTEFPGQLLLQTRAALQKWQEKFGPMGTYRALIKAFVRAGRGDCAEAVCKVLANSTAIGHHTLESPIHRYATYLKGVYESAIVSSDKFPNLMCSEFINLALVKSDQISRSQADEFTRATLHGYIDEILQKKEPIKLEEVMKPVEGQRKMKCVYMHGAPGIGKSTCVGELCKRWDEMDSLKKYSLVILLRLREKRLQDAQDLKDLCYHGDREVQEAVAAEIRRFEGKGVLFILDGFDELPASLRKSSIFVELISGAYLSHCTILVTSRPSATADLLLVAKPQIHKQVEVIGFTQENIKKYAKAYFASQPSILTDFLTYISTHPAIRSFMYIPLNCAITTETYSHNRTFNRRIPQTMTQLFIEMSLTILQRHLGEDGPLVEQLSDSLEDLPFQFLQPFSSLAKLAFDGLERKEVIFHKLSNNFVHFGFMNSPTELYMGRKASISHSFLHLTLQEFLAAFHISQCSPSDQLAIFEKYCETAAWDVVWKFVAGLTGFSGIGWEVVKLKRGWDTDGDLLPFLVQCLYESQGKADCDSVLGQFEVSFHVKGDFSMFNSYAVGYCVANSSCMWRLTVYSNGTLGGAVVDMLINGLRSPPQKEHANILSLNLIKCGLNSSDFNQLAAIIPLMTNLVELDISLNSAGEGGLVRLLYALSRLKRLKTLYMYDTKIGFAEIEPLSHLISPASSLKELIVGDRDVSPETAQVMLRIVLSPSSLESLGIKWNFQAVRLREENYNLTSLALAEDCLTPNAFDQLADVIPFMINLKELNIRANPAGNGRLVKLLHALSNLKHLQVLDLSFTRICYTDIEPLSCLISPSSSLRLKELVIGDGYMSPETTETVFKTVLAPSSLELVVFTSIAIDTMSDNTTKLLEENKNLITLEIVNSAPRLLISVAEALCKNSYLKVLHVSPYVYSGDFADHNLYNYEVISSLREVLLTNQTLEKMQISYVFSPEEILVLDNALQFNYTLKAFEICTLHLHSVVQAILDPRLTLVLK